MKQVLKGRSAGFYIGLVAAAAAIGMSIAYTFLNYGDKTYSNLTLALVVLAVIAEIAAVLSRVKFVQLIPALLMGGAVGIHLYVSFPSITDLINKIVFIGGNSQLAVQFAIYFAIVGALFVIANFFEDQ